jgi:hypothetical protein
MMRQTGIVLLAFVVGVASFACNNPDAKRRNEENTKKWNEFWGKDGSSGGLFSRRSGDPEVWTIECSTYRGDQHAEMADKMATALKKVRDLRPDRVRVENAAEESRLYYGEYKLKYVEAKLANEQHAKGDVYVELSDEIKRDLGFVRSLALGERYPFLTARAIPKPTENVGPSEWDLRNAKGVYTLHVGVTYDTPTMHSYKEAAVEWVKALRDDGFEAYYYHAPDKAVSDICVGTFGDDAVTESFENIKDPETGEPQKVRRVKYSDAVSALRDKADFRFNLENGHKVFRAMRNEKTGQVAEMPNESFLVKIPHGGDTLQKGEGK